MENTASSQTCPPHSENMDKSIVLETVVVSFKAVFIWACGNRSSWHVSDLHTHLSTVPKSQTGFNLDRYGTSIFCSNGIFCVKGTKEVVCALCPHVCWWYRIKIGEIIVESSTKCTATFPRATLPAFLSTSSHFGKPQTEPDNTNCFVVMATDFSGHYKHR